MLGATGLIEALADDYLSAHPNAGSITWVCNHSRNTQLALLHGYVDIALTYERDQEIISTSEGWAVDAGCVFHDHFCLAGPLNDPAGIKSASNLSEALSKIFAGRPEFHSRADTSATMWKERSLWSECGLKPWESSANSSWYKTSLCTPAEALTQADKAGAYLLTDRSTILRQTGLGSISESTVFFEPMCFDDPLMNSCHALYSPCTPTAVEHFIEYLKSSRGQNIIGSFGVKDTGFSLFAPVASGFARTQLSEGVPLHGRWVTTSKSCTVV